MNALAGKNEATRGPYSSLETTIDDGVDGAPPKTVDGLPDLLSPPYTGEQRKSSRSIAVFSLLNTILGGGILSLPYAFMKSGALIGIFFMTSSVFISTFSLQLLCKCARKTGSRTYSDVMRKTMGVNTPEVVDVLMFLLLKLVLIAFCVLVKSISGDLAEYIFLLPDQVLGNPSRNKITTCIFTFFVLPLMTLEDLYALRYASYVGMASVCLLTAVLVFKASQVPSEALTTEGRLYPAVPEDLLTAVPIMLIAFLCQFNAVEIFCVLKEPTKEAVDSVMRVTITFSGCVFAIFGIAGYVLAFDACSDNILNNFSPRDPSLVVARSGLVFTLICQLPMVGIPCRNLTILVYGHLKRLLQNRRSRSASILSREQMETIGKSTSFSTQQSPGGFLDSPMFGGDGSAGSSPLFRWLTNSADQQPSSAATTLLAGEQRSMSSGAASVTASTLALHVAENRSTRPKPRLSLAGKRALNRQRSLSMQGLDPEETQSRTSRVLCACMLVVTTLVMGELLPGVSIIWTIAGSSVSLLLAFILPSLAYIMLWRIANEGGLEEREDGGVEAFQWKKPSFWKEVWHSDRDLVYASLLFVASIMTAPVCTYWSIHNLK